MKPIIIVLVVFSTFFISCKKYLDLKPDKAVAVPSTLQDVRVILNNQSNLNSRYAAIPALAADNYYVNDADYASFPQEQDKIAYRWQADAEDAGEWSNLYKIVFYANTALDALAKVVLTESNAVEWNACKGEGLFFRSLAFFEIAQVYCAPYVAGSGNEGSGIPLRLTADVSAPTVRSTIAASYRRITEDLELATTLLPVHVPVKTRPCKAAAFGVLARVSLAMEEYTTALRYSDSALLYYNQLIDFNTVNASAAIPFAVFNNEVIFHSYSSGSGLLNISRCKIDSFLYSSYVTNDLRKTVYFRTNNNGTYGFKAECEARLSGTTAAMQTLNKLLEKRWKTGTFIPFTAGNNEEALSIVLTERRKELLFRGVRWQDIRRLNRDARFVTTLTRKINGQLYSLPPGDLRYVMLIPSEVIALTGIEQNPR